MNHMQVPEQVYFMTPPVHPITNEINDDKSRDIDQDSIFYLRQGQVMEHERINTNGDRDLQYAFGDISDA